MGRIHGFLGGVLLTSAATYYTGEYMHKNLHFVLDQLRFSEHIINDRILSNKDEVQSSIPRSSHSQVTRRLGFGETSKDIWNDEIIKFANWVYSINWYQWGLDADHKILELANKVAHKAVEKKE